MLSVDWLGCILTAAFLSLILPSRWRLPRALIAMLLGEAGRVAVALTTGSSVSMATLAGVFTRLDPAAGLVIRLGGLWLALAPALLLGRRLFKDTFLYAAAASLTILVFLR